MYAIAVILPGVFSIIVGIITVQSVCLIHEYTDKKELQTPFLSIIIPYHNEAAVLAECHQRLLQSLDSLGRMCEIIYVDDGSSDPSWQLLQDLLGGSTKLEKYQMSGVVHDTAQSSFSRSVAGSKGSHQVICLRLSRNFGKEAAMCAGLQQAQGQAVIILDADLQDPPELIPKMVKEWQKGFDVVDMQRLIRHGETWFKCLTAKLYYRLINRLSDIPIPENVGDFRLLDRRVVDEVNRLPERTRFMKGIFAWPGFKRTIMTFEREPRYAGQSKWKYSQLLHLAFEGLTSFSTKPLRMATIAGILASLAALLMACGVIVKTLLYGDPVAGYPSLISVVLLLGGIQLLSIGIVGEYLGRLFIEAKQRPLYVLMEEITYPAQSGLKEMQG